LRGRSVVEIATGIHGVSPALCGANSHLTPEMTSTCQLAHTVILPPVLYAAYPRRRRWAWVSAKNTRPWIYLLFLLLPARVAVVDQAIGTDDAPRDKQHALPELIKSATPTPVATGSKPARMAAPDIAVGGKGVCRL